MSPRQRARRRARRRIIRIERLDVYVDGNVAASFAIPTFRGRRYNMRTRLRLPPIPPMVTWFQERWNEHLQREIAAGIRAELHSSGATP